MCCWCPQGIGALSLCKVCLDDRPLCTDLRCVAQPPQYVLHVVVCDPHNAAVALSNLHPTGTAFAHAVNLATARAAHAKLRDVCIAHGARVHDVLQVTAWLKGSFGLGHS